MLVAARVFLGHRVNLQEKYDYPLKALADKDWLKKMSDQGIHLLPEAQYAPEAFAKHTAAEVEKWRKVATDSKIQID